MAARRQKENHEHQIRHPGWRRPGRRIQEQQARMKTEAAVPPALPPHPGATPAESDRDQTSQNIEAVLDFYTREEQKISRSQRILERISRFVGQPVFLGIILL